MCHLQQIFNSIDFIMHLRIFLLAFVAVLAYGAPVKNEAEAWANLKAVLEGELRQRNVRQQDEVLTDMWGQARSARNRHSKDVDLRATSGVAEAGWTQEDIETLIERLPDNDVRIIRDFARLARRLNTARKLVLELNKLQDMKKKAQDHPVSGFDPKYVGTREQDMHASTLNKIDPVQSSSEGKGGRVTEVIDEEEHGGQWLDHPLSESQLERALSVLQGKNILRKREDEVTSDGEATTAVTEEPIQHRKPSDKDIEAALLAAVLAMKGKDDHKQR